MHIIKPILWLRNKLRTNKYDHNHFLISSKEEAMTQKEKKIIETSKEPLPLFESNRKYFTIAMYALFVITIGSIIVYMIMNWNATSKGITKFFQVLTPFFAAFIIAYLMHPIANGIDRLLHNYIFKEKMKTARKFTAIIIAYILAIGGLSVFLSYLIPSVIKSLNGNSSLYYQLSDGIDNIIRYVKELSVKYPDIDFTVFEKQLQQFSPEFMSYGSNLIKNIVPFLFNVSINVVKIAINILLSVVISCYMLFDKTSLKRAVKRVIYAFIPRQKADNLCVTLRECNSIFGGFLIGKSIDSLIIGILCFIIMTVLQLPYAALLSLIVGVTNMIPYFGPFIGVVPGVLIYLLIDPIQSLIFAIMIFILQQFDGLYLGPKILGQSTGIKPLWIIFAITVGGAYFGVLGMFLGVPVVAVIAYLLETFVGRKLKEKHLEL